MRPPKAPPTSIAAIDRGLRVRTMCLPDRYIEHASPDDMHADAGLDVPGMVAVAMSALRREARIVDLKSA